MTEPVIVIGAGIGGLAATLRLAHAGRDVLVFERHSAPGGKMRTLPSDAGPVDAGPTVMTMRPVFDGLFADVGERLDDHVTLHRETVLARHWWRDGSMLDLHADPETSAAAMRDFAGARAEKQFRDFCAEARRLYDTFDGPMMQEPQPNMGALAAAAMKQPGLARMLMSGKTLAQHLARRFDDPRLRQLFGRYATYVGGSPFQAPALLSLIWHAEALGVWRVEGGMHRLARALEALATAKGARFHYDAHVAAIETDRGAVTGIRLADGRRIGAAQVLFNGDPRALQTGGLGAAARKAVVAKNVEPRSLSAEVWAFAARPQGAGLVHHNVFFGADPRAEFDPLARGAYPADPTLYLCAQDRGTAATTAATNPAADDTAPLERFEIILNAPPWTPGTAAQETRPCPTTVFETFGKFGLSFSPTPAADRATGPQGFDTLFPASQGSLYGRSPHGLTASLDKPRVTSRLKGLYLAGGGVHPGAGIPMATLSGRHAAAAMLKDRASISGSTRTATRGGTSTASRTTAPALSRSSGS